LAKEKQNLGLWLICAIKMWAGSPRMLTSEFSEQQNQRNLSSDWRLLWTGEKLLHAFGSFLARGDPGRRVISWAPSPRKAPAHISVSTGTRSFADSRQWNQARGWRKFCWTRCELWLETVWQVLVPPSPGWLRLHHGPCFCGGRSRLFSTQLPIFPKTVGEATPLDLSLPLSQVLFQVTDDFRNYEGLVRWKSNTAAHASFHSEIRIKLFFGSSYVSHGCNFILACA